MLLADTHLTVQRKIGFSIVKPVTEHSWSLVQIYCRSISGKNTIPPCVTRLGLGKCLCFAHVLRVDIWDVDEPIVLIQKRGHDTVSAVIYCSNANACPLCDVVGSACIPIMSCAKQKDGKLD